MARFRHMFWRPDNEGVILHYLKALNEKVNKLMAAIDDYITAQQGFNAKISSDLDAVGTDVTALNAKITDLTNQLASAGLTPAQTQALADLTTAGNALQAKADALSASAGTPPTPPAT